MYSMKKITGSKSRVLFWGGLVALTVAAVVMSLAIGSVALAPAKVLEVLLGHDTTSNVARIVLYSRLPRTCAAMLAGAALAVSGTVIQMVLNTDAIHKCCNCK